MSDTIFMETTKIAASRSAAEIQAVLCRYKAQAVLTEYDNGEPSAISFRMRVGENDVPFRLPCRWQAINALLKSRGKGPWLISEREAKAKRVAWRQILRWVQAQLALVETNMVKVEEVFLPYVHFSDGQTFFERVESRHFAALTDQSSGP